MWDLIVSVPDHCLSFYFMNFFREGHLPANLVPMLEQKSNEKGHFSRARQWAVLIRFRVEKYIL